MRHPIWSGLIVICVLLAVIVAGANGSGSTKASSNTVAPSQHRTATSAAHTTSRLACDARAVTRRPAGHTIAEIRVRTVAGAELTASGSLTWLHRGGAAIRANARGIRTLRFRVGSATPGVAVMITVRVSRGGSEGSCEARLRPRPAPAAATAAQPTTSPPAAAPPPPPAASCYPLSDEGTCYEPGEFCRDDDHGMTGLAGDGETIVCEDNDGWRWEPA
jgi:hypothetical protein